MRRVSPLVGQRTTVGDAGTELGETGLVKRLGSRMDSSIAGERRLLCLFISGAAQLLPSIADAHRCRYSFLFGPGILGPSFFL